MNFIGHIKVAIDQLDDGDNDGAGRAAGHVTGRSEILIGAVLPDVAAMGRFRLMNPAGDPAVRSGVVLHHRTDDAFHGHQWFREHSQAVTVALSALGLARGAARACGHVGVELLLDGFLLDTEDGLVAETDNTMSSVIDQTLNLDQMVESDRRVDWQDHLNRTATWPVPTDYRDPNAVAERLRRILARRPRLSFDRAETSRVADVLAERQHELEQGVETLLADLRQSVSR